MADHAGDHVEYWVAAPARYVQSLYALRKWPGLKMATADGLIWLRGFSREGVESVNVVSIPLLKRYYLLETRLYPLGKSLPALVEPSLLWTDPQRGLKITLPEENFNYFGVARAHRLSLVPSEIQRAVTATVVSLPTLGEYLYDAPRVRLAPLRWTVLEGERALLIGTPLLPIRGQDYYIRACFLIPAGWALRFASMANSYQEALGDGHEYWYILNEKGERYKLRRSDFNHLSKGSFVNTKQL
ncbi:hypothetical protein [Neolewinella antarctica]|uniref:MoxR-vWA-beta-propeller ternary system domain-containing protein n=1 Tax=Neolewinella antarctica TaxID=442734 RepID=A0ABX0XDX5_9BACT|nr:hypothetical protein [Neolewinella antarctica]NJC27103.1 hypothetical protein [Neolewinella antarctica]